MKTSNTICYSIPGLPACAYAEIILDQIIDQEGNVTATFRQIKVYDNSFSYPLVFSKPFISDADTLSEYNRIVSKFTRR